MRQARAPWGLASRPRSPALRSSTARTNFYPPTAAGLSLISQYRVPDRRPRGSRGSIWPDRHADPCRDRAAAISSRMPGKSIHDLHPRPELRRSQSLRRCADGDRLQARLRSSEEAKAYVTKLRTILRYLGTCRRRYGEGQSAARTVNVSVRRPGDPSRHALRDQERQFDPLHRPGHRARRRARQIGIIRGWRHDRPGDAAVRPPARARRARCAPRKRRMIPLLPRSRPAARWNSRRISVDELATPSARAADEKIGGASSPHTALSVYDAGVLIAERESADFFRARRQGRDGKAAANWEINDCSGASTRKASASRIHPFPPTSSAPSSI